MKYTNFNVLDKNELQFDTILGVIELSKIDNDKLSFESNKLENDYLINVLYDAELNKNFIELRTNEDFFICALWIDLQFVIDMDYVTIDEEINIDDLELILINCQMYENGMI